MRIPEEQKVINAKRAVEHNGNMEKKYAAEISASIAATVIYGGPDTEPMELSAGTQPEVIIDDIGSVEAVIKYAKEGKRTAVLNFADFKNIGGKYMLGEFAQEEALCHGSFLYSILKEFPDYYKWNIKHMRGGLYEDRAIYAPDVVFLLDKKQAKADVITCASPRRFRWAKFTKEENSAALKQRIHFIHQIAAEQKIDTLILGAFGCGVFSQSPKEVATLFQEEFAATIIKTIVYAIPPAAKGKKDNLKYFKETIIRR